ncbi:unnamed protein product [Didymodactylos carnosus]|uniref:KY-like immunoglobulin-like domain-containing protein n=1 Tax=Didymodactylos carnosus TaxID=1234261 RepID=A0A814FGU4_9BILA|nr:unnamed protein product [Didymodactylos carnosus]CAF0979836.1 unnamed protein product [Didymodactylos carnosus]CAF3603549.1 unnamed protein product [Didymodactylos carnosus]CAF3752459.1 unnamed protein product [Didymodactylos carnosus]
MGSCCCKGVRVSGIPEQQPSTATELEEQRKRSISCHPLPMPTGFDIEKNDTQSTATHLPPLPNQVDTNKEDKALINFRLQQLSNEGGPANESKPVIPSQLPPIRQKIDSKRKQQRSSFRLESRPTRSDIEDEYSRIATTCLPPLQKTINSETDDNLVQLQLEESDLDVDDNSGSNWRLLVLPEKIDFSEEGRYLTSTPIPPNQTQTNSDEEYAKSNAYFLRPVSNHIVSDDEHSSSPLTLLQIQRLREHISLDEHYNPLPKHNSPIDKSSSRISRIKEDDINEDYSDSFDEATIHLSDTSIVADTSTIAKIDVAHREAFDESFMSQRQRVIGNSNYRIISESWCPNSIEQLVDQIKSFSKNKPVIDRLWIVFYWITRHIEYGTVPYIGKKREDKSAEAVFRTTKGMCEGYANLFKRLCDDLSLSCEMDYGDTHTQILIRAPDDVELIGRLTMNRSVTVFGGDRVFFDRGKGVWRCMFAPCHDGLFEAYIMAKKRSDPGSYPIAVRFKIAATRIPMPPLSYPRTWHLFHDLDLRVEVPLDCATVTWPEYASYAIVCIRAPEDVRLTCCIQYNDAQMKDKASVAVEDETYYRLSMRHSFRSEKLASISIDASLALPGNWCASIIGDASDTWHGMHTLRIERERMVVDGNDINKVNLCILSNLIQLDSNFLWWTRTLVDILKIFHESHNINNQHIQGITAALLAYSKLKQSPKGVETHLRSLLISYENIPLELSMTILKNINVNTLFDQCVKQNQYIKKEMFKVVKCVLSLDIDEDRFNDFINIISVQFMNYPKVASLRGHSEQIISDVMEQGLEKMLFTCAPAWYLVELYDNVGIYSEFIDEWLNKVLNGQ